MPYISYMGTKQLRSEYAANVALVLSQATARQGSDWTKSAPVRSVAKRGFVAYVKALFSSFIN